MDLPNHIPANSKTGHRRVAAIVTEMLHLEMEPKQGECLIPRPRPVMCFPLGGEPKMCLYLPLQMGEVGKVAQCA